MESEKLKNEILVLEKQLKMESESHVKIVKELQSFADNQSYLRQITEKHNEVLEKAINGFADLAASLEKLS